MVVGPAILFTGVLIGQPLGFSGGVLTATATVPLQASGPPTLPNQPLPAWEIAALVGGGLVVLGGGAAVLHERRKWQ